MNPNTSRFTTTINTPAVVRASRALTLMQGLLIHRHDADPKALACHAVALADCLGDALALPPTELLGAIRRAPQTKTATRGREAVAGNGAPSVPEVQVYGGNLEGTRA
jgi:hypothetical protein